MNQKFKYIVRFERKGKEQFLEVEAHNEFEALDYAYHQNSDIPPDEFNIEDYRGIA